MKLELFQVALQVPITAVQPLEEGLQALQLVQPPLCRVEVRRKEGEDTLLVLLGFEDRRSFIVQHTRVGALGTVLSAQLLDLEDLDSDARAEFENERAAVPLLVNAEGDLSLVFSALKRHGPAARLRVGFDS